MAGTSPAMTEGVFQKKRAPRRALSLLVIPDLDVGRAIATALGHVGVELLAVLGPLQFLDEVAEVAGFLVELAALFLEALDLAAAVIVEGRVAGAGKAAEAGCTAGRKIIPCPAEGVAEEGLGLVVFRISTHFPHQI